MSKFMQNTSRLLFAVFFASVTCFAAVLPLKAVENTENQNVRNLLDQAAEQAAVLDYDADQMTGLLFDDFSWQTHAAMLDTVRDHVNSLGRTIAKLEAERGQANSWQRQTIDRAVPLLRDLANNTTEAIDHLNKHHVRPLSGNYPQYLEANADTAHELSRLIGTTVEYGHTMSKLERLQERVQMASNEAKHG
jgi:hypothetical protein